MENYSKLTDKLIRFLQEKDYQAVIDALPDTVLAKNKNEIFYLGKGNAYYCLQEYEHAIVHYEQAIKINPLYGDAYNKLGNVYCELMEYGKAIPNYEKTIEIYPKKIWGYYNLGVVYSNLRQYDKAIGYYEKVISMDSKNAHAYYTRGKAYFAARQYELALADFKQKVKLTKDSPNHFTEIAKDKIAVIEIILNNKEAAAITEIASEIKNILKYNESHVIHYTGISTGKSLILENSLFRLNEATFVNSATEGKELIEYLSLNTFLSNSGKVKSMKQFNQRGFPFIGSFVPVHKEHDMELWKMCGKGGQEERKGCAITFQKQKLVDAISEKLIAGNDKHLTADSLEDFTFYRVAYLSEDRTSFIIPEAGEDDNIMLNACLQSLKKSIDRFYNNEENNASCRQYITDKLNEIIFLFKCPGCIYEHEIRMIVKGRGFEPVVDLTYVPPRVYIELVPLKGVISKVTLGPDVAHANELASAFSYHFKKQEGNSQTKIFITDMALT